MKPILILVALLSVLGHRATAAAKPLNILILYADNWRYNTLGCAGNPVVQTPQLDQFARDGMRRRFAELKAAAR